MIDISALAATYVRAPGGWQFMRAIKPASLSRSVRFAQALKFDRVLTRAYVRLSNLPSASLLALLDYINQFYDSYALHWYEAVDTVCYQAV